MDKEREDARRTPQFGNREPASEAASKAMSRNSSVDTRPELLLRRELWQRGLRYRLHAKDLPGSPDVVFRAARVAIFCDGDFWHGKNWEDRKRVLREGTNADYWIPKIESNIARDKKANHQLRADGWTVIRFWESDIKEDVTCLADHVEATISEATC